MVVGSKKIGSRVAFFRHFYAIAGLLVVLVGAAAPLPRSAFLRRYPERTARRVWGISGSSNKKQQQEPRLATRLLQGFTHYLKIGLTPPPSVLPVDSKKKP